jgi:hypothetical protein
MIMGGGPSVMTNAKGAFRIEGLQEGRRLILATAEGFAPAALQVHAPSEGNMLFLEKPGTIRVTVVRDGKPEANAMVRLDTDAEDAPIPSAAWSSFALMTQFFGSKIATTNDKGVAVLTNIPPGEWNVAVADFSAPVNDAESTKKALDGLREASLKAAEAQPAEPADLGADAGAEKAKEGLTLNNKLESLFKRKKARVRVYPEQEASARVELAK